MVTHRRTILVLLAAVPLALAACDRVPLLAPTGSVITLLPQTTTVSLNSQINIIATVIENGTAPAGSGTTTTTSTGGGTPVQNGTVVSFTTTLGTIQPSEARTHNGQVTVTLTTGNASGTATITAYSGGASASTQLKVGTAGAKTVNLAATPQALGAAGGTAQLVASVTDEGGNPIGGVPVTFATDKGSVSPSTVTTDTNGNATATLTTTGTAKVTATAGTITSTAVTVSVNTRSLAGFSASPSAASAGTPIVFTVTPAAGANITNVRVDFGDGNVRSLGAISVPTPTSNIYSAPGSYTATATATDATGEVAPLSTTVIIGALPVTLSASPNPATVNSPVTFTVSGIGSAQVDHYEWTISDPPGTPVQTTGSPQLVWTFASRGLKTVRVDVFAVGGGRIASQPITIDVQ
jgi:PKD repeat protein